MIHKMNYTEAYHHMANRIVTSMTKEFNLAKQQYPGNKFFVVNISYANYDRYEGYDSEGHEYTHFDVYFAGSYLAKKIMKEQGINCNIHSNSIGSPTHMLMTTSKFLLPVTIFKSQILMMLLAIISMLFSNNLGSATGITFPMMAIFFALWITSSMILFKNIDTRTEQRADGKYYRRFPKPQAFVQES